MAEELIDGTQEPLSRFGSDTSSSSFSSSAASGPFGFRTRSTSASSASIHSVASQLSRKASLKLKEAMTTVVTLPATLTSLATGSTSSPGRNGGMPADDGASCASDEAPPPLPPKPAHLQGWSPSSSLRAPTPVIRPGTAPTPHSLSAPTSPLSASAPRPLTTASASPQLEANDWEQPVAGPSKPALPPRHPASRTKLLQPRPVVQRAGSAGREVAAVAYSSSIRLSALASRVAVNAKEQGAAWHKKGKERLNQMQNRAASAPPSMSSLTTASKRTGVVFGRPLVDVVRETRMRTEGKMASSQRAEAREHLPAICWRCLEYLDELGVREEGLYRIPGPASQVNQLRASFDSGDEEDLRLRPPGELDPHAVASVFKMWLRELPESILTAELERPLDALLLTYTGQPATSRNSLLNSPPPPSSQRTTPSHPSASLLAQLKALLIQLPLENWYLLRELATHLARMAEHAETTRLTLDGLRLILSPTLRISPAMMQILVERREVLFVRSEGCRPTSSSISISLPDEKLARPHRPQSVAGLGIADSESAAPGSAPTTPTAPPSAKLSGRASPAVSLRSHGSAALTPPLSPTQVIEAEENAVTSNMRQLHRPPALRPRTVETLRSPSYSPLVSPTFAASKTPSLTSQSSDAAESVMAVENIDHPETLLVEEEEVKQPLAAPLTSSLAKAQRAPSAAPSISELDELNGFFADLSFEQRKLFFEA